MRKRVGIASVAVVTAVAVLTLGGTRAPRRRAQPARSRSASRFMGIFSGQFATPGADNPFKLAVAKVNSSGGILGRKLEYKEFDTDITPQGASTATSLAMQYNPDVVIGYGVSAGLKASAAQLSNVLVIHNTLDKLTTPDSLGSDLTFRLQPTVAQFAGGGRPVLVQGPGCEVALRDEHTGTAPTDGSTLILSEAQDSGVKTDHRAFSPTVTDLTEPILAAKSMNADAIWEWGYPTTDGLTIKTAGQNGFKGGIMTFSAGRGGEGRSHPADPVDRQGLFGHHELRTVGARHPGGEGLRDRVHGQVRLRPDDERGERELRRGVPLQDGGRAGEEHRQPEGGQGPRQGAERRSVRHREGETRTTTSSTRSRSSPSRAAKNAREVGEQRHVAVLTRPSNARVAETEPRSSLVSPGGEPCIAS